jgi:hypothetical protein
MQLISHKDRLFEAESRAFRRAVQDVVGEAKQNAPVSVSRGFKLNALDVQGGLRASITSEAIDVSPVGLSTRVGSAVRHAAMREFGGTIVPVRRRLLAWQDPITGEWRFAKRVVQKPGGPRQGYKPWLRPAGDKFPAFMDAHLRAERF